MPKSSGLILKLILGLLVCACSSPGVNPQGQLVELIIDDGERAMFLAYQCDETAPFSDSTYTNASNLDFDKFSVDHNGARRIVVSGFTNQLCMTGEHQTRDGSSTYFNVSDIVEDERGQFVLDAKRVSAKVSVVDSSNKKAKAPVPIHKIETEIWSPSIVEVAFRSKSDPLKHMGAEFDKSLDDHFESSGVFTSVEPAMLCGKVGENLKASAASTENGEIVGAMIANVLASCSPEQSISSNIERLNEDGGLRIFMSRPIGSKLETHGGWTFQVDNRLRKDGILSRCVIDGTICAAENEQAIKKRGYKLAITGNGESHSIDAKGDGAVPTDMIYFNGKEGRNALLFVVGWSNH